MSGGGMNMEEKKEEMEIIISPAAGGWLFRTPKVPSEEWAIIGYRDVPPGVLITTNEGPAEYWRASSGEQALGRFDNPFKASEAVRANMQRRIRLGVLERLSRTDTAEELLTAFKNVIGSLEYYAAQPEAKREEFWEGLDDPLITQGRALIKKIEGGE